ncbi:MAG: response regulator [Terrimonas sp.]|nr:response regulator [Terrimonas sp.]
MQVLIAEDELPAVERLKLLIDAYDPAIEVVAVTDSIADTVNYLSQHPHPDLLLLDIHLSDGHSFEIFKKINFNNPVIFTTAYDQYALEAFKVFSIDYILKPVTKEALALAINKFRSLAVQRVPVDYQQLINEIKRPQYKSRFLAKGGTKLFFIDAEDIAFFQADNKIVYLVDNKGNRYIINYTLDRLESLLDPKEFFRLNRKFIVRMSAIEHIRPYYNSRLKIAVKGSNEKSEDLVISRERVSEFKVWAES